MHTAWVQVLTLGLVTSLALAAAEQPPVPAIGKPLPLAPGRLEIGAGQEWSTTVSVPVLADGELPVLGLRAYAQAGDGGCNYVLQVFIDGLPLGESPLHRRLLNKLPDFDPPNTAFHFAWYEPAQRLWMTMFGRVEPLTWGGSGRDTEFLFDLSGLVQGGRAVTIGFRHGMPSLPAAVQHDRAPLVVTDATLGVLRTAEVARLRQVVEGVLDRRPVPIAAALSLDTPQGEPPYEVAWSGRQEAPVAQVAFEDLTAWTALASGDLQVALRASAERRIWRSRTACLTYSGGTAATTVLLRPARPIPVSAATDAGSLWLFPDIDRMKDTPPQILALLEDSAGREFSVDLGQVRNSYWELQHGVLSPPRRAGAGTALRFTGLAIALQPVKEGQRRLYLESLAFYARNRKPFSANTRPAKPAFPINDDGMLPTPPAAATVQAAADGQGARFSCVTAAGTLRYRVSPAAGLFEGIQAQWNDGPWFRPMAGGDITLEQARAAPIPATELLESSLAGGSLHARWQRGSIWEASYGLRGQTLVVDVRCAGGAATGLQFGRVVDLAGVRSFEVPYLRYGWGYGPRIACGGGLFVAVLADWYHSACSRIDGNAATSPDGGVALMAGTIYRPLTDGRRNDLAERVLITASPEFRDTLPSIPHPASPHLQRLAPYLFVMASTMQPNRWRTLKRYGLDYVMTCDFASFYVQDYAEGFAGRWRPHPSLTLGQIRDYRRVIKDIGFLFGTYSDLRDWFPLNEFWDENCVSLEPDGDLADGWYGNYRCKPNYLPVMARLVGEKAQAEYPPDTVYMDTHSCAGADACDFEAGVPGAGRAREQIYFNGDCMLETRKWYGSVVSEGAVRWLYAGIADVDYASLFMSQPAHLALPLVDFDLEKIHPLNLGTMMGYSPEVFLGTDQEAMASLSQDRGAMPAPEPFYHYVATSLAYGHMLMLGYSYLPPLSRTLHLYALMQGLQTEYLPDTVAEIRYHDGTGFVSASQALANGTLDKRRLRVRYRRGLTLHINLNPAETWSVEGYELPPFGWLATGPNDVLAYSALIEGQRVDAVRCPGYLYLAAGVKPARLGALEVQGAAWLKREAAGWRLIPCGDLGPWQSFAADGLPAFHKDLRLGQIPEQRGVVHLALDTQALLGKAPAATTVQAFDAGGKPIAASTSATDRLTILTTPTVVDYLLQ